MHCCTFYPDTNIRLMDFLNCEHRGSVKAEHDVPMSFVCCISDFMF